jgi:hypothetical protein
MTWIKVAVATAESNRFLLEGRLQNETSEQCGYIKYQLFEYIDLKKNYEGTIELTCDPPHQTSQFCCLALDL